MVGIVNNFDVRPYGLCVSCDLDLSKNPCKTCLKKKVKGEKKGLFAKFYLYLLDDRTTMFTAFSESVAQFLRLEYHQLMDYIKKDKDSLIRAIKDVILARPISYSTKLKSQELEDVAGNRPCLVTMDAIWEYVREMGE